MPFGLLAPKDFQIFFYYECTCCGLFQKCIVNTNSITTFLLLSWRIVKTLVTIKSCTSQVLVTLGFFVVGQQKIRGVTNARLVLQVVLTFISLPNWRSTHRAVHHVPMWRVESVPSQWVVHVTTWKVPRSMHVKDSRIYRFRQNCKQAVTTTKD